MTGSKTRRRVGQIVRRCINFSWNSVLDPSLVSVEKNPFLRGRLPRQKASNILPVKAV